MPKKISLYLFICLASISCSKSSGNGATPPSNPVVAVPVTDSFIKGADISWLTEMEANNIKFYNTAGVAQDGMALMKSIGFNTVRLRVWVNPADGYNNQADVVAKAIRANKLGFRIMIDFHYSDNWADPGKQSKPAAWAFQDFNTLKNSLASHTTTVLAALKNNNISPNWVQVGNETNDGMLWPEGRASTNMSNFATLISAGYDAVKNVFPSAKVIVHISNGFDNKLFRWMFDGLTANAAKYDIIGMSMYPTAANWATYNSQCLTNMNDMVSRYNKQVMVVEAGMSWTDSTTCNAFLTDLIAKTKAVSGKSGLGVMYWEPEAYNWKGYTLGAFDNNGKPTIALKAFEN